MSKGKPFGHWAIKENCLQESLKYKTRGEFQKGSSAAYNSSLRNGWLDDVCSHMIEIIKPKGYWTKKNCKKESLKYISRSEFKKGSGSAYQSCCKNGWLDEICKDMEVVGNLKMRCIYVFEFEDNYAYVGLTGNFKKRYNKHMNSIKSSVYKHIEETNLTPKFIQLTDYMDEELASKEETVWENKYISEGWNMLNMSKTGGLGGFPKWDYVSCQKESLKYNTRNEFYKGSSGAYQSSWRNGWLDDICSHMIEILKPNGYWTKENCLQESLKYKTRSEFYKGSSGAYFSSRKNGWLSGFYGPNNKPTNWDYDTCKKEALKYKTRGEFQKGCCGAYKKSWKNKWLDEFFPKTEKGVG